MANDNIITPKPSIMPIMAMRTISFENVRFDLNVIRADIKEAKLNAECFLVPSQICGFAIKPATF
ncbi:hypothetical protein GCM10022210_15770 [Mucilaginibacter dorajii]|uniref:Uncharacterized protein n=1 Tax=Mucilaginibacter dorajii TaxID=692994 RepID=A0ABP7PLS5_9SPHI